MEFISFPKMPRLSQSVIVLTNGGFSFCSEEDFDRLSKFNWFHVFDGNQVYAMRDNNQKGLIRMHAEVMGGIGIDHINGDGLDNRRSNLRFATNSQNQMNRGKFSVGYSKFKGVSWHKRDHRWVAKIMADGRRIHLGNFINEFDAAKAYNDAASQYFGKFARLNQI